MHFGYSWTLLQIQVRADSRIVLPRLTSTHALQGPDCCLDPVAPKRKAYCDIGAQVFLMQIQTPYTGIHTRRLLRSHLGPLVAVFAQDQATPCDLIPACGMGVVVS